MTDATLPRLIVLWLVASLLAACASAPEAPADIPWSAAEAAGMNRFILHGKVGFRRGETGGSAALTWQQDGDRYRLQATGPLGQGATRITGNSAAVRIETGDGTRESSEPAALLAEAIGWPVSINSLSYWVRGLAAPGDASAEISVDAEGRPVRIRQLDWDISLDRYRGDNGRVLPHRVIATGGESRVTLLVERWEFAGMRAEPPAAAP